LKRKHREQAQQTKGVREKKRKVKEGGSELITDDNRDKENSHPNLPITTSHPSSSPTAAYTCRVVTVGERCVLRLRRVNTKERMDDSGHKGCRVM
jgi:hypothetical protein